MRALGAVAAASAAAAGIIATSLVLAGCVPPYLEALDKAARLTHQMTEVGSLGAVGLSTTATTVRLLPPKPSSSVTSISQVNVQSGFLVFDDTPGESVTYAYRDSGGNIQNANSLAPLSLAGADGHYPLYQYEVTQTTTTAQMVVYHMDPNGAVDTAQLLTAGLPPSGSLSSPLGAAASLSSFNTAGNPVFGESVMPGASGGPDLFQWFVGNGSGVFEQFSTTLLGTTAVFNSVGTPTLISMPLVPNLLRFMYYSAARSYLEYYSGGWICLDITSNASPVQLAGISHRIDALLTDGDLLSTENDTLTLYDPNGSQLLAMPMGGLRFCYEAYVGTTPYCFFSLPMQVQHGDWIFAVYAIPTSQMRGL